ncbi:MAG: PTS sugar transporter subunit IIC [Erysipelotrichaceae bacterium]|nr:PTS sugar transporter subunit IIC [Erysipelotrichaceae bacterium]
MREKLDNFLGWIASEVHLLAIRDALMSLIPFLSISGVATFFAWVLLESAFVKNALDPNTIAVCQQFFIRIGNGCLGLMSVLLVAMIPYFLGRQKGFHNPILLSVTGLCLFFVFNPLDGGWSYFGTQGVLLAMIIGLTSAELFMKLAANEKLRIDVGENVPQAVKDSFNSLITILIMILLYALIATVLSAATGKEAIALLSDILQKPLLNVGGSLPGAIVYTLVQTLLFSVGIHPGAVSAPLEAVFIAAGAEGKIVNYTFLCAFGMMGGTGSCLGLCVALVLFSKRKELKQVGRLAVISEIFNINEPLSFGVPIVFNPILMVAYVLIPLSNVIIGYFITKIGLISVYSNTIPWSTPFIFKSIIGANGDIRNIIAELVVLVWDTFLWLTFLRIYEKQLDREEAEDA